MKKAKVIEIFTRKEITEMPYKTQNAKDVMKYLMDYKNPRTGEAISSEEYQIINQLVYMMENNSGVTREEVFQQGA
jgi:hypothetical protein